MNNMTVCIPNHKPLAAIRFEPHDLVDDLLERFTKQVTSSGKRVSGVLQSRGDVTGECHCADMDLQTIGSNRWFRISQSLGSGSRGCRLDPGALAHCAAFLEQEIQNGCDLLVLNRFGKGEADGRGFRDLISSATCRQIPVLVALRDTYRDAWHEFCGGYACELRCREDELMAWFRSVEPTPSPGMVEWTHNRASGVGSRLSA